MIGMKQRSVRILVFLCDADNPPGKDRHAEKKRQSMILNDFDQKDLARQ